eukprot:4748748-Pleurochrysis_carterae.AAC.2
MMSSRYGALVPPRATSVFFSACVMHASSRARSHARAVTRRLVRTRVFTHAIWGRVLRGYIFDGAQAISKAISMRIESTMASRASSDGAGLVILAS